MVEDISKFILTKDNAKEFYFINKCKMSWIDKNGSENSAIFRSFAFEKKTLDTWTNEWIKNQLNYAIMHDQFNVLEDFLEDYSDRINKENTMALILFYESSYKNFNLGARKEMNILYHFEEPVFLKNKYEYGLIYITYTNKCFDYINQLMSRFLELNENYEFYNQTFIKNMKKRFSLK